MAAAHPYGAFVGCGIKRIGCARRIKVKAYLYPCVPPALMLKILNFVVQCIYVFCMDLIINSINFPIYGPG